MSEAGSKQEVKEKQVAEGLAVPRGSAVPHYAVYVAGETRCPFCKARASDDPEGDQRRAIEESVAREQAEAAGTGTGRVTSTQGAVRYMKCFRCSKTFKALPPDEKPSGDPGDPKGESPKKPGKSAR